MLTKKRPAAEPIAPAADLEPVPMPDLTTISLNADPLYAAGVANLAALHRRRDDVEQRLLVASRPKPSQFAADIGDLIVGDDTPEAVAAPEHGAGENPSELRAELARVQAAIDKQSQVNDRLQAAALRALAERIRPFYSDLAFRIAEAAVPLLKLLAVEKQFRWVVNCQAFGALGGGQLPLVGVADLMVPLARLMDQCRAGGYTAAPDVDAGHDAPPVAVVDVLAVAATPGHVTGYRLEPAEKAARLAAAGHVAIVEPPRRPACPAPAAA